jgi:hypothetical protein
MTPKYPCKFAIGDIVTSRKQFWVVTDTEWDKGWPGTQLPHWRVLATNTSGNMGMNAPEEYFHRA